MDALKDSTWSVQNIACWLLGRGGGKQGIQYLMLTTLCCEAMRSSQESRGEGTQTSFSLIAGLGTHLVKPKGETIPVNVIGTNRELLSLRMSVQHLPSELRSLKNVNRPTPTTSPTSQKDCIAVIRVTPDSEGLAGYLVHPLLVQGFLLQRLGYCCAVWFLVSCMRKPPALPLGRPFSNPAVHTARKSFLILISSEFSLLQQGPLTARYCLCTKPHSGWLPAVSPLHPYTDSSLYVIHSPFHILPSVVETSKSHSGIPYTVFFVLLCFVFFFVFPHVWARNRSLVFLIKWDAIKNLFL